MKIEFFVLFAVVLAGLFESVQMGAFLGVCALLYAVLIGNKVPQKREYERENQPRDPNA